MASNEEGKVVRNAHMCTSQGSSLIPINVRRVVETGRYFLSGEVGQKRRMLMQAGVDCA